MSNTFLRVRNGTIVGAGDKPVMLRGVNVGGWLMKEAYFVHAPAFPEKKFKKEFMAKLGERAWADFNKNFLDTFIVENDFRIIKSWGCNCVRVPFHYNTVENKPYVYKAPELKYLDNVVKWAAKYKIYVILDMHAVPGSQNHDWHSDSAGEADFWKVKEYRHRACALWTFLANRYKDAEFVAGYDILNEAVLENTRLLNDYYHDAIAAIRRVDRNHILFIEGNRWATNIACLDHFDDYNYALSIHSYEPLATTFNLVPVQKYPNGNICNRTTITRHIKQYADLAKARNLPVYVGEFGVNYRDGACGEDVWLKDNLELLNKFDFHWTYWPYKSIKNLAFPDGIYSYYPNPPWVNRAGPFSGWDTYHKHWPTRKKDMIASWKTAEFTLNTKVADLIKKYAKRN